MRALLRHRDHRGVELVPAHGEVVLEPAPGPARRAVHGAAVERDHVEVAQRAEAGLPDVLRLLEGPSELRGHVAAELRRPGERVVVEHHRLRGAGAGDLELVDDRGVHRERQQVHRRQGQPLPLLGQRAADRDEAGHPGPEHPLVEPERDHRILAGGPPGDDPLDDGAVRVGPEQHVDEHLEPARQRAAQDRHRDHEPVGLHQPLPEPPRVVGDLPRVTVPEVEVGEPDQLDRGAGGLRRAQRLLEHDVRAPAGGAGVEADQS